MWRISVCQSYRVGWTVSSLLQISFQYGAVFSASEINIYVYVFPIVYIWRQGGGTRLVSWQLNLILLAVQNHFTFPHMLSVFIHLNAWFYVLWALLLTLRELSSSVQHCSKIIVWLWRAFLCFTPAWVSSCKQSIKIGDNFVLTCHKNNRTRIKGTVTKVLLNWSLTLKTKSLVLDFKRKFQKIRLFLLSRRSRTG